jgi:hypothetical protein
VHTGTGLWRSQRRNAQNLASMIEPLRAQPPEPRPVARQTHAEASDVATEVNAAAIISEAKIRPIQPSLTLRTCPFGGYNLVDSVCSAAPARAAFTNWKRVHATLRLFLGGGAFMQTLGRALCGVVAAASLWIGAVAATQAAGALAVGACGAYGFAYDYAKETEASRAALGKCAGGCKVVPVRRACGAIAIDGKNACGPHGYAVAGRLGEAQNTALRQCYQYGGKECVIRAWACDAKG